ncbi:MAG: N-6 DNA methylase [bacterium]|nr:N-6 DNA methylase [bacterium]
MTKLRDIRSDRLRSVRTADELLRYFIDELDWPLEDETLEDEDLTFDFDLEVPGVPSKAPSPIKRVRQVRPFTPSQPCGIFFVELTGPRLLITRLRGLLATLISRRKAARDADRRSWDLDDLIFVVTTGEGDATELHLLVFFEVAAKVEFRCLSWRPADSTPKLRRLAEELLPKLRWPDDEHDMEAWRSAWRSPFTLQPGYAIRSAARLADRMARTARDLRDQIREALADEDGQGPFSELMVCIRQQLVADINEERFADMCAQTLVYGLLGSRVTDPDGFGATPVLSAIPLSNAFLSAFFEQVHGQASELDLEGSGLEQLIADLRKTDVEAILDDFGATTKGGDPVIHFYEEFLKKYDRKLRAEAGAFYTPEPVVEFMVRGVDEILRTRFGLEAGIADPATWQDVAERVGFDVPEGVTPERPFISMIDPASGTGTFLVHWLRRAKRSFEIARPGESWRQHLGASVLPSMHAFEFMLGPYTIAHLKLALQLHDEGLPTDAAQILLTNTLDHDPHRWRLR